jgi:hypothetical protein
VVDIEPMLAAVDWRSLSHAYGPAVDTPDHLRGLLDEDAARVTAYTELNGSIWHQNTVYEATVAAVPVLSAIARSGAKPGYYALALLLSCAEASDLRSAHRGRTRAAVAVEVPVLLDHVLASDDAANEPSWTLLAGIAMLPEHPIDSERLDAFLELAWGTDAAALLTVRQLVAQQPFPPDVATTPIVDLAFNSAHRVAGHPPLEPGARG